MKTPKIGVAGEAAVVDGGAHQQPEKAINKVSNTTPRNSQYRVMDEIARKRRLKRDLDNLELDNFHEDPHANLSLSKKVPKFEDGPKGADRVPGERTRRVNLRLKILSFAQLVEEDSKRHPPNYCSAIAPSPDSYRLPRRHFCAVCGFNGIYTCVVCGARFCSISCQKAHKDTRCMKYLV